MKEKTKNILILALFVLIIGGFFIVNLILPDNEISYEERRKLQQFPDVTIDKVLSTEFMKDFDKYTLDQFAFRNGFRKIKAFMLYNVFNQKDNGGVYEVGGNISKVQYPLDEKSIVSAANKFNKLMQEKFPDANVFYSVIPDKNFFMANKNGFLDLDYDRMLELLEGNVKDMEYIDIINVLELEDYYLTDLHWKQENLFDVAEKLAKEMGVYDLIAGLEYSQTELEGFKGVYSGQYALNSSSDTLKYLTNDLMKNWTIKILDEKGAVVDGKLPMKEMGVYAPDRFTGTDPYDVYLHGANPLITIENGNNPNGKELFIFRDSFSSSLTPLLVEGYSKVTLIDLRYIQSSLLEQYVDFGEGNDVLFLYGSAVLNGSGILKVF